MSDKRHVELTADVASKEAAVREAWASFLDAQQQYVRDYLMAQGRTTAIEQETLTENLPGGLARFRRELTEVVESIAVEMNIYLRAIGDDVVLGGWPRGMGYEPLDRISRVFGNFMIDAGYDPGEKRTHPGIYPDWYYYSTEFTVRPRRAGKGAPLHELRHEYSRRVVAAEASRAELEAFEKSRRRGTVADEWDAATA